MASEFGVAKFTIERWLREADVATPDVQERITAQITEATLHLLRNKGPKAVTVKAVAARAGVARQTVYRRYANRIEMLVAAVSSVAQPIPANDEPSLLSILTWLVDQCRCVLESGIGVRGLAALLTGEDQEFTEAFRVLLRARLPEIAAVIHPAVGCEGSCRCDIELILDTVTGLYVSEHARTGQVHPGWTSRALETVWPLVTDAAFPVI